MSSREQTCILCINPTCAFFETGTEGDDICLCGHSRLDHRSRRQFRPRGGLSRPGSTCVEFQTIGGQPIESFHQQCVCGGRYSEHLPAGQAVVGGPQPPTLSQRTAPHVLPTPGPLLALPPPANTQPPAAPTPPSFGLRAPIDIQRPATQLPQMRPMVPYVSAFAPAMPEPVFGVPLGQPGSSGTGRQRLGRRNNQSNTLVQRTRKLCLNVMIVILPRDIDPNARAQDRHGFSGPSHIPSGELLDQYLKFLKGHGLASTVELKCKRADESLLPQILEHFNLMVKAGPFIFPTVPDSDLLLSEDEPNRDLRLQFARLPFRVVRIGNASIRGTPALSVDHTTTFLSFTYHNLSIRFSRKTVKHPTDNSIHGLFFICPKDGRQLTGPVNDNLDDIHPCYNDFIIAGLAKGEYLARSSVSKRRRLRDWKTDFPYRCRVSCPGVDLELPDMDSNASITPPSSPAPGAGPSQVLRNHSHLSSGSSTTLSPLIVDLDITHQPPPSFLVQSTSPTPMHQPPFVMPERPSGSVLAHSYGSNSRPEFSDFEDFEMKLQGGSSLIDDHFRVSGSTVEDAADALISAIKSSHQNHQATFHPSTKVRCGDGGNPSLSNILLYRTWLFDAGPNNQQDVVGTGVMREVLMTAIQVFLNPERGIVEDLGIEDGFVSLKISADFVCEDTLDDIFTFGALCAIFMIKAHLGPDPVSPALIQAAIGGPGSLVDADWVTSTHQQVAEKLCLLPIDGEVPIPDDRQLRWLFEARLCRFSDILRSRPAERERIVRSLYINTLLGASERVFQESLEFKAFSKGIDLFLSPDIPSFAHAIKSSLKYILATSHNQQISSPFQVIDRLDYDVQPSAPELRQGLNSQLDAVKLAVERYLLSKGHPFPDRIRGLIGDDILRKDNLDHTFRARRFVKITSGLEALPVERRFTIVLKDVNAIPTRMYCNNTTDLVPPYAHACLYQLDLFVNDAFCKAASDANVILGIDTEFDWMMHTAIMKIGVNDGFNG